MQCEEKSFAVKNIFINCLHYPIGNAFYFAKDYLSANKEHYNLIPKHKLAANFKALPAITQHGIMTFPGIIFKNDLCFPQFYSLGKKKKKSEATTVSVRVVKSSD